MEVDPAETITELWHDRMERDGFFNYTLDDPIETKIEHGRLNFVIQFNEQRGEKKRRGVTVTSVRMPFDYEGFNFLKIRLEEVLMMLPPNDPAKQEKPSLMFLSSIGDRSPHLLAINASPIEKTHVLFIPNAFDRLPQQLTKDSLVAAIGFRARLHDPSFKMGFNSLGGEASVNHLHFHCYQLDCHLPIESFSTHARTRPLDSIDRNNSTSSRSHKEGSVNGGVYELVDFPIPGLVFELVVETDYPHTLPESSVTLRQLYLCVDVMQRCEMAHNVCILPPLPLPANGSDTDTGTGAGADATSSAKTWLVRVVVFPRRTAFGINQRGGAHEVAFMEMSGHFIAFNRDDFNSTTNELCVKALQEAAIAPELYDMLRVAVLREGSEGEGGESGAESGGGGQSTRARL